MGEFLLICGKHWQPTFIKRTVERLETSAWPIRVLTDVGQGYLKCKGRRPQNDELVTELVCTELAGLVDLKCPDFAIYDVKDDDGLVFCDRTPVTVGSAFISRRVGQDEISGWSEEYLSRLKNKEDILRLVIFDTWIQNFDRCAPEGTFYSMRPDNLLVVKEGGHYRMVPIDHTHCLSDQGVLFECPDVDWTIDEGVYGLMPGFMKYLIKNKKKFAAACFALGAIKKKDIQIIFDNVPTDWGLTENIKLDWVNLLFKRAHFLSRRLPGLLFEQEELII